MWKEKTRIRDRLKMMKNGEFLYSRNEDGKSCLQVFEKLSFTRKFRFIHCRHVIYLEQICNS